MVIKLEQPSEDPMKVIEKTVKETLMLTFVSPILFEQ
jgi:hypothetical protein